MVNLELTRVRIFDTPACIEAPICKQVRAGFAFASIVFWSLAIVRGPPDANTRTSCRRGSAFRRSNGRVTAWWKRIAHWMLATGLDNFVATHDWVWPVCEILHFFGMAAIIGTVGAVDCADARHRQGHADPCARALSAARRHRLLLNLGTGFIFVAGNPVGGPQEYLTNLAFLIKMSLILIAGRERCWRSTCSASPAARRRPARGLRAARARRSSRPCRCRLVRA